MLFKNRNSPISSARHIFISYRRDDSSGEAGRLIDSFKRYFAEDQIFRDIDRLEPGVNFTHAIPKYLDSSSVMLIIMGHNWLGQKADGSFRIQEPTDWVRIELGNALQKNIPVIPVLVNNASLPGEVDLPDELKPFLNFQKYEISDQRWGFDVEQLAHTLSTTYKIPLKDNASWLFTEKRAFRKKSIFYAISVLIVACIFLAIIKKLPSGDHYTPPALSKEQKDNLNTALELGDWCQKQQRYTQALEYYREAQIIAGDDPEIIKKINLTQEHINKK